MRGAEMDIPERCNPRLNREHCLERRQKYGRARAFLEFVKSASIEPYSPSMVSLFRQNDDLEKK